VSEILSEWLRVMLGEIARKREDAEQARVESRARAEEAPPAVRPGQRGADRTPAG
jgi:hypothetical protein